MLDPPASPDPLAGCSGFSKVKDLGIGSFGCVSLYRKHEGRGETSLCAVKFMPRSGSGVEVGLIQREVQSHRVLRHPHVIRFKNLGLTATHIFMCMEFADQGDLLGFLRRKGPLPEADARWLFQQMIFGLDYCHQKGVVNRDLKPENLLLKLTPEAAKQQRKMRQEAAAASAAAAAAAAGEGGGGGGGGGGEGLDTRTSNTFNLHIKIADFGLSKKPANSLPKTRVGTINYMAPEVLLAGPSQRYDGAKADIWSAGVVLFAMLFSRVPFEAMDAQGEGAARARDRAATIQRILQGEWSVPPGMSASPQVLHLLSLMLVPDPARRIPMQRIVEHPWFRAGLPPAALTMNVALVRQQEQQAAAAAAAAAAGAAGAAKEQSEEEIDAILEVLRLQVEQEEAAAAVAAGGGSEGSGGRRSFDVQGAAEEEGAASPPPQMQQRPQQQQQGPPPQHQLRPPPPPPQQQQQQLQQQQQQQQQHAAVAAARVSPSPSPPREARPPSPLLPPKQPQAAPPATAASASASAAASAAAGNSNGTAGARAREPSPPSGGFLSRLARLRLSDLTGKDSGGGGGGGGGGGSAAAAPAGPPQGDNGGGGGGLTGVRGEAISDPRYTTAPMPAAAGGRAQEGG